MLRSAARMASPSPSVRSRKRENDTAGLYREAKAKRVTKQETVDVKENEADSGEPLLHFLHALPTSA